MVKTVQEVEGFVNQEFPVPCQRKLPGVLRKAHKVVRDLVNVEEIFLTPAGNQHYGYLVNLSFELWLDREIKALSAKGGQIEGDWFLYKNNTGKNYRIITPKSVIIPIRLKGIRQFPRKAVHRELQRLNNKHLDLQRQMRFAFPNYNYPQEPELEGKSLILMPHGHKTPSFIHLAIPDSSYPIYSYTSINLMKQLTIVEDELPPVEGLDAEAEAEVREDIIKVIKDGKQPD